MQTLMATGSLMMLLAVVLGAFGAHALKSKLTPERAANYQTAVQYQIAHALGMLFVGGFGEQLDSNLAVTAGWLLFGGIVVFSGSLYILSLTGIRKLGAITPIGGLAFIAGWLVLAIAIWQG